MKRHLPALLFGLGLSAAVVSPAAAYPVDCAILLCLAGGWLSATLTAIVQGHKQSQIDELLPWIYAGKV